MSLSEDKDLSGVVCVVLARERALEAVLSRSVANRKFWERPESCQKFGRNHEVPVKRLMIKVSVLFRG